MGYNYVVNYLDFCGLYNIPKSFPDKEITYILYIILLLLLLLLLEEISFFRGRG